VHYTAHPILFCYINERPTKDYILYDHVITLTYALHFSSPYLVDIEGSFVGPSNLVESLPLVDTSGLTAEVGAGMIAELDNIKPVAIP